MLETTNCRSPQGECGLKYLHGRRNPVRVCRSPQGECGLKCHGFVSVFRDNSRSPQGECGLKFLDRLVKRSVPGSLSLRRAWIEIGVCGVPATAWMSLSLFMSSVLRTCGDDSACAGLLVSMTIRGGENEFMGTRAESQMRRTSHAAHITIPARHVGHEFPDRRCRGPFPDIRNT